MKKIDKRACRKFCIQPLRINPNHGLLHADAINYIVRATVRAIGGKRLLVLSFFPTKGVSDAVRNPKYVVFQGKDDFITLEHCDDGKTKWRRGNIMWLDCESGNMKDKSAFYSQKDEKKVIRFCNPGYLNGLVALSRLQGNIAELRTSAIKEKRQLEIVKIMKPVDRRRLPKGLLAWVEREVIPAHIFYDYRKGKTIHSGYCSRCKAQVQVENPRHNKDGVCPNCQAQVTFHAIGRHSTVHERETVQVIQNIGDALVSRIIKVYFTYRNSPEASVTSWECSRMFFTTNNGKYQMTEYYWANTNRAITQWIKGPRPQFSRYHYYFNADTCAYVYLDNLRKELKDTPWQYSQLKEFCENTEGGMYLPYYLKKYYEAPALEYIVRLRLYMLAINAAYGNRESCTDHRNPLNLKGNGLKEVLGIGKEHLPMLQAVNPNTHTLYVLQELLKAGVSVSVELLNWCQKNKVYEPENIARCLKYTSAGKLMSYIMGQVIHVKYSKSVAGAFHLYKDYIRFCEDLGYDLQDGFILYPRNVQEAHDNASKHFDKRKMQIYNEHIARAYPELHDRYGMTAGNMMIIPPKSAEEIVEEGQKLHHCVGGYVTRVVKKESVILFLRNEDQPDTPFYTIEVKNGTVAQVRGDKNCSPTPEVEAYMTLWKEEKLLPAMQEAA